MLEGIDNLSCEREDEKNGTKYEHIPDIIEPFKTHTSFKLS